MIDWSLVCGILGLFAQIHEKEENCFFVSDPNFAKVKIYSSSTYKSYKWIDHENYHYSDQFETLFSAILSGAARLKKMENKVWLAIGIFDLAALNHSIKLLFFHVI